MSDMTTPTDPAVQRPLRLWPGVLIVALQWLGWFVLPVLVPDGSLYGMMAGAGGGLAVVAWWLAFSRAPWFERIGALVLMAVGLLATSRLAHASITTGMMGMMLLLLAIPVLSLTLVTWAVASQWMPGMPRRASLAGAVLLACGVMTLARTGGITGDGAVELDWRWTESPEERLLASAEDDPVPPAPPPPAASGALEARPPAGHGDRPTTPTPATPAAALPPTKAAPEEAAPFLSPAVDRTADPADRPTGGPEWPGFRGRARDGIVRGLLIDTDWSRTPPVELWRRPVGPGWSSFAVAGDSIYTQEQRGDDEVVSCYRLSTGEPVWRHRDPVRFWESNGGAGPRATPTVHAGRVYTFGATGIVNVLDARTGARIWSRSAAADTDRAVPDWGFASSPLVIDDLVVVSVAGQLAAYDVATGRPRWLGPEGGAGYSSPHPATIGGVRQILLLRGSRTISVAPADGTVLWEHVAQPSTSIVQPALAADGGVLIAPGDAMGGIGMRRLAVARAGTGWTVEERWTTRGLKPYFNDFVVHEGHAYGFDGSILASIDLEDGTRRWKGGRYGHGQLILLPEQDVLLVLSEDGELALVAATPDQYTELARIPAIEGKTWNHPVLVGDVLLVRNGQEMAAYRLPPARER
jgi:outer membrane protein assembly factor BamB